MKWMNTPKTASKHEQDQKKVDSENKLWCII